MAAGLDHHHGLHAGRGAGCRHELAGVADGFDVEQNGACALVEGEVVEAIAKIHVGLVAERHHAGEADVARGRPFDQPGCDGA